MENNLIVVKQLPVIEDQLLAVKNSIEERVSTALSLVCTEETYKDIKKVRSDLNKEYAELEKRRKEIKGQILAPYEQFEGVYKECAGDMYAKADRELGAKIKEVEDGLKKQKADDLAAYFAEYRASLNIPEDFVTLDAAGIKIGLSDSRTSLHKQAAAFLDMINGDLEVIEKQEHPDEVLTEYKKNYNLSGAIITVDNRHKAIEAERIRREQMKAQQEAAQAAAQAVKQAVQEETPAAVAAPVKVEQPAAVAAPVLYQTTFTVTATIEELKALKAFLIEGGYKYEQH